MSTSALLRAPELRPGRPLDLQIGFDADLSPCGTLRWSLYRWFTLGTAMPRRVLPWIMLNPSTADAHVNDPTLWRIILWSWRWGFDGLLVVNLFPFRTPDQRALARWAERAHGVDLDQSIREATYGNWRQAADLLRGHDAAMVAWGAASVFDDWWLDLAIGTFFDRVNDPERAGGRDRPLEPWCLGTTRAGAPIHPMARGRHRIPDDALPHPFPGRLGSIALHPFDAPPTQMDLPR